MDNLGDFIEAEKLTEKDVDGVIIAASLWTELEKLGVHKSDEVFEGYDVLMNRKTN